MQLRNVFPGLSLFSLPSFHSIVQCCLWESIFLSIPDFQFIYLSFTALEVVCDLFQLPCSVVCLRVSPADYFHFNPFKCRGILILFLMRFYSWQLFCLSN